MPEKRKILIVDDDPAIVKMLKIRLETEGYDTALAVDGQSALKLFRDYDPDAVLLDIAMPSITGIDVLDGMAMSRPEKSVPVFIISAYPRMFDQVKSYSAVKECFLKPFDVNRLAESIASAVA